MIEREGRKPAERWCLGYRVPVIVFMQDGRVREGTVSALNPRKKKGLRTQPKGLFLDGPRHDDRRNPIEKIITLRRCSACGHEVLGEIDITKYVKMSYGPAL